MTKGLLILAAIAVGFFAVDSYLTTRAAVKTLKDDNKALSEQLTASRQQHNAEGAIGLLGMSYSQQGAAKQEKTQIEIHKQIIREPCAVLPVPDVSAQRLWQLTENTRAAALPDSARQSDGVTPAAAAGK